MKKLYKIFVTIQELSFRMISEESSTSINYLNLEDCHVGPDEFHSSRILDSNRDRRLPPRNDRLLLNPERLQIFRQKTFTNFWRSQNGVSLIETLVIVVMVAVMVFLMANIPNAMNLVNKAKHTSLAREIAVKQIEDKRSISYVNLPNDTTAISDPRIGLLPAGSGTTAVADCDEQVCVNDENVKQITVTIFWKDNNKDQKVTVTTLIGEGGLNQ